MRIVNFDYHTMNMLTTKTIQADPIMNDDFFSLSSNSNVNYFLEQKPLLTVITVDINNIPDVIKPSATCFYNDIINKVLDIISLEKSESDTSEYVGRGCFRIFSQHPAESKEIALLAASLTDILNGPVQTSGFVIRNKADVRVKALPDRYPVLNINDSFLNNPINGERFRCAAGDVSLGMDAYQY